MNTIQKIKQNIVDKINKACGEKIADVYDLVLPPDKKMGDFSYPCFKLAKQQKNNPAETAKNLSGKIKSCQSVKEITAVGPYLNFVLQEKKLVQGLLSEVGAGYGKNNIGKKKKIIVEYACPNVNKAFHIGHLRNIITGEAIVRLLENSGYKVIRANYQGDVGMHIAKSIWGILQKEKEFLKLKKAALDKRIAFLSKAYVAGAQAYESDEKAKLAINELNRLIYEKDSATLTVWEIARQWSLQYFETIYKKVGSRFDYYFFESEMSDRGVEIVRAGINKNIFRLSEGAIIFAGAAHGLHDRVFVNSQGFPTYEAKDLALAELWFKKFKPDLIIHVVGKEQTEYFKVVFKALAETLPQSIGKELHLPYGWVTLKNGKMSSRLGSVVLGEDLMNAVKAEIKKIIKNVKNEKEKDKLSEKISLAAIKFSFLKNGLDKDISFDMNESVNLSGNSGPYVLYTYARIKSILNKTKKSKSQKTKKQMEDININDDEKNLFFTLSLFPDIAKEAAEKYEPSLVVRYLFELSQSFNDYYHKESILKSSEDKKWLKLALIEAVSLVLQNGSDLLGFEVVEKM